MTLQIHDGFMAQRTKGSVGWPQFGERIPAAYWKPPTIVRRLAWSVSVGRQMPLLETGSDGCRHAVNSGTSKDSKKQMVGDVCSITFGAATSLTLTSLSSSRTEQCPLRAEHDVVRGEVQYLVCCTQYHVNLLIR